MKKLLLALSIVLAAQSAYSQVNPDTQKFISPGLTSVEVKTTSKIEMISAADCTRSTAEAHAYAYPASGYNNTLIRHHGRHEAIITNCTGQSGYFNVQVELISPTGARTYENSSYYLPNQSRETKTYDLYFNQTYPNAGYFNYTARTTIQGPASHSASHSGTVSIR